jgi:hypothetical protein
MSIALKLDIPPEQLARIQPRVDQLLAHLRLAVQELPAESDSALVYPVEPEDQA